MCHRSFRSHPTSGGMIGLLLLLAVSLSACAGNAAGSPSAAPASTSGTTSDVSPASEAPHESKPQTATCAPQTDGPASESPGQPGTPTADGYLWDMLTGTYDIHTRSRRVAGMVPPSDCPTAQGGWFDGRYWYQLMIGKDTATNEQSNVVRLCKVDVETGETVRISDPLPLNHANDLTYNTRKNVLIAVHNNPNRKLISLIDPETLTVTETVTLPCKIYSLAYCPERDRYVAGLAGGQTFCLLDAEFRQVAGPFEPTEDTAGYITQGCACDARFIYFVLYNQNVVTVYDWDGNHIRTLPITVSGEPENITQSGGKLYIATGGSRVLLYRLDLQSDSSSHTAAEAGGAKNSK